MKADARAAVENSARVILASVSMAAEAFDCSRLNAIILATPKSDVVQSIGRIMRTPPGAGPVAPLIIDPQDPLFAGPARKRRTLYKKRAYTIDAVRTSTAQDSDDDPSDPAPVPMAFRNKLRR